MNIGQAAAQSGISAKMIRYYESIRLLDASKRTESGYRVYHERDLHALRFIRRARDLGFSLHQIDTLMALWRDKSRASSEVKQLTNEHIAELERKATELQEMAATLKNLADHCHGNDRPDCPIIDNFGRQPEESRK